MDDTKHNPDSTASDITGPCVEGMPVPTCPGCGGPVGREHSMACRYYWGTVTEEEAELAPVKPISRAPFAFDAYVIDKQEERERAAALADEAFNEAVAYIQDKLGIDAGDFAAVFFSEDENRQTILEILGDYAACEIENCKVDEDEAAAGGQA